MGEVVTETITIASDVDYNGLYVGAYASHPGLVEFDGPSEWRIDVKAGQSTQVTTTLRFVGEGNIHIYGAVKRDDFVPAINAVLVEMKDGAGRIIPAQGK